MNAHIIVRMTKQNASYYRVTLFIPIVTFLKQFNEYQILL